MWGVGCGIQSDNDHVSFYEIGKQYEGSQDRDFIANAPSDIDHLLELNDKLVETLKWYADQDNYFRAGSKLYSKIEVDEGDRAIKVLKGSEG